MTPSPDPSDRLRSRALGRELFRVLVVPLALTGRAAHRYAAGTVLLEAGRRVDRLPFVEQGRLDAVVHLHRAQGGQVVPRTFGAGEIGMLSQLFSEQVGIATVVVAEDAVVRWVPVEEVEAALLDDPARVVLLVRFLGQRLREVQTRERALAERGVHERVCAALVRLAADQPRPNIGPVCIEVTHEELAVRCGVSRPKASLALKRLEREGRVALARGCIEVRDLPALEDLTR